MVVYYAEARVISNDLRGFAIGCMIAGLVFLAIGGLALLASNIEKSRRKEHQIAQYH